MLTQSSPELVKSVLVPDMGMDSTSAEEQTKRRELFDKTQKEWAEKADKALEEIRGMMKTASDTLSITGVIDVYTKLQDFEYALRSISYRLAERTVAKK